MGATPPLSPREARKRAFHFQNGRTSRIPECCIRWFVDKWPKRHQGGRVTRWFFQAYKFAMPTRVGFVPCPKHLVLESLGITKVRENFHQHVQPDGTYGNCTRCGAEPMDAVACRSACPAAADPRVIP